jgi:[glutamine synthetase] adenylyltransferase / [glutamine synthetase]-adenylyl-L-tyrosine phosphorylase
VDTERAAEAIAQAAAHPDLVASAPVWSASLLASARPASAARLLAELARARRDAGAPLDPARVPLLPALLGNSSALARALQRHPDWIDDIEGALPPPPRDAEVPAHWSAIREAKYRGLLRVAARDLAGRPFEQGLGELSDLADRCLRAALACAAAETGGAAPALLALGKLGGRELNFSSDVDLLFVYELAPGADPLGAKDAAARLIRVLKTRLEEPGEEGFGYRVDLNLRPEGRSGVLANPVDAALTYYESFGAEWERQMLIRLRPLAGPAAGERFARGVVPFVYRSLIGLDVMRSVREMKARIERERREAGRDIDADLKEGPGGIRDVEFLVQAFQLLHGGREPQLRTGNVLDALRALGELELLPFEVIRSLREGYLWLRRAEHALQLADEQQTARMPSRAEAQAEQARRMGYRDARTEDARARMLADWSRVQAEMRRHFDALVLGGEP